MANKKINAPFTYDFGSVGKKGVFYMKLQYWVDVCSARKIQEDMKKNGRAAQYRDFCYKPWFSPGDFDDLLTIFKKVSKSGRLITYLTSAPFCTPMFIHGMSRPTAFYAASQSVEKKHTKRNCYTTIFRYSKLILFVLQVYRKLHYLVYLNICSCSFVFSTRHA